MRRKTWKAQCIEVQNVNRLLWGVMADIWQMTSTRLPNLLSASVKLDNEQQYKFQTSSYVSLLVILAPVVI